MKKYLIAFALVSLLLPVLAVHAVEDTSWGAIKAQLSSAQPAAKAVVVTFPIEFTVGSPCGGESIK